MKRLLQMIYLIFKKKLIDYQHRTIAVNLNILKNDLQNHSYTEYQIFQKSDNKELLQSHYEIHKELLQRADDLEKDICNHVYVYDTKLRHRL